MTPQHWDEVKSLFQRALEEPPSARAAFLAAAGAEERVRVEVESLLEAHDSSDLLMDALSAGSPALLALPGSLSAAMQPLEALPPGTDVGPYRVVSPLGAGGMGEVFRARDGKLNRDVALKVLPGVFAFEPDRLARFGREARVLAALNHPHIAAIYGLEESNGRQALVLELVEGVTLAERIASGPMPVSEALTIARQIAEALEAAHEKEIIHRDLKPANIKITPDGVVKVLDFGLAKTAAVDLPRAEPSPRSNAAADTRVGVVLGTAAYMSPEQARGREVDARTDIWAFGCVLFEMLAGRKAFAASATTGFVARVLDSEPDWAALPKETPVKVRDLLRQCLQNDRAQRTGSIVDARVIIEQVMAPRALGWPTWTAVAATAILAISVSAYVWFEAQRRPFASRSEWVQLTNLDSATQPALSPDGRLLAFIRGQSTFYGPGQVYVKRLPDGEPVALTNDDVPKMSPVFSPDGTRIAYTAHPVSAWDTWEVPIGGGPSRRWLRNASGLTWIGANDLLFSEVKTGLHMAIVRSDENRAQSRDVYVPPGSGMAHRSYVSPDRTSVLVVEMDDHSIWLPCRVLSIDGSASHVAGPSRSRCTEAAWSPDGRWMYFTADAGDGFHVWRQRFPDGTPEQLTSGPTEEEGLTVARDGKSLITSVGLVQRSVWFRDATGERQISLEGYAYSPLLTADGRKVCFRVTRGVGTGQSPSELWLMELDSGRRRRLFPGQLVTGYDVSRDDRVVAAVVERDGQTGVWLAWLDGREPPRRIPRGDGDNPRFGRDGEIVFRIPERDTGELYGGLYRVRDNGEGRERVGRVAGTVFGTVSPDGEWLSGIGTNNSEVAMYSTSDGSSRRIFPYSPTSRLRWSLDGTRAYLSIQYGAASSFAIGRTYVLPLANGSLFPAIPPGGFRTEADLAAVPGVEVVPHGDLVLGASPAVYAFSRVTTTRNLYRIPLE